MVALLAFVGCGGATASPLDKCLSWIEHVQAGELEPSAEQQRAIDAASPFDRDEPCEEADLLGLLGDDGSLSPLALRIVGYCGGFPTGEARLLEALTSAEREAVLRYGAKQEREHPRTGFPALDKPRRRELVRQEKLRYETCAMFDRAAGYLSRIADDDWSTVRNPPPRQSAEILLIMAGVDPGKK